jgi:hypothetical protein
MTDVETVENIHPSTLLLRTILKIQGRNGGSSMIIGMALVYGSSQAYIAARFKGYGYGSQRYKKGACL